MRDNNINCPYESHMKESKSFVTIFYRMKHLVIYLKEIQSTDLNPTNNKQK